MRKLLLIGLLLCAGCAHRAPVLNGSYTLEDKSGYSLLVPSLPVEASGAAYQTTLVTLQGRGPRDDAGSGERCVILGRIFSLTAAGGGFPTRWVVRSLSPQGWESDGAEHNIHAEWNGFVEQLLKLERQRCFPEKTTVFAVRRAIAESLPLPATESAFFLYSFGGTDFVDLAPGMEIKLERPLMDALATTTHQYSGSLEATYEVNASSDEGVGVRLLRTANRRAAHTIGSDGTALFELSERLRRRSMLRLFLQSAGDGTSPLPAILIGASSFKDLESATKGIETNGRRGCPATLLKDVDCLLFSGTAVSLMSAVTVNGKSELLPFGTSVGYMVGSAPRVLETLSLSRSLAAGGYTKVNFARTVESVQQIVLLPGDRLDWKQ